MVLTVGVLGELLAVGTKGVAVMDAHVAGLVGPLLVEDVSVLDGTRASGCKTGSFGDPFGREIPGECPLALTPFPK